MHTSGNEPINAAVSKWHKRQVAELSVYHVLSGPIRFVSISPMAWFWCKERLAGQARFMAARRSAPLFSLWSKLCRGQPRVKRNDEKRGGSSAPFFFCLFNLSIAEKAPQFWLGCHQFIAAASSSMSPSIHYLQGKGNKEGQEGCSSWLQFVALQLDVTGIL